MILKNREVLVPTSTNAGTGGAFQHPQIFDYTNPITAIFKAPAVRFLFETRDGMTGENDLGDKGSFERKEFDPAAVSKMLIHYTDNYIDGFEMFGKEGALICDQSHTKSSKVIEILF